MSNDAKQCPDSTPVLVGAGQATLREATNHSPMQLAGQAAQRAIEDCGAKSISDSIDTIAVVRLFSDSPGSWSAELPRSNNPPESVAQLIGANPGERIYSAVGGNMPLSLLIEFARGIATGKRRAVLLAGSEALRNQKDAMRKGHTPDWGENYDAALEDRPAIGSRMMTRQEVRCGLPLPMRTYSLIEQARRHKLGMSLGDYQQDMARLLLPFNKVASDNPLAQFPDRHTEETILGANTLTHLYTSRMIAQDGVNQGAALLLTSAGHARELGISEDKWVFLHGAAEGEELCFSEREDPAESPMAAMVARRALEIAALDSNAIGSWDIYSCFPCAITTITDQLDLPTDGSVPLTLTGGLPFFGGPGNNYSMHGLAEAVGQCRQTPEEYVAVTANGGFLSKHAAAVFSARPRTLDWNSLATSVSNEKLPRRRMAGNPGTGSIRSYVVNYRKGEPEQAMVLGETDKGERFTCATQPEDHATVTRLLDVDDATGLSIHVTPGEKEHQLFFTVAD